MKTTIAMAILVHSIKNPFCNCEGEKCVIRPKDSMVSTGMEESCMTYLWERAAKSPCMKRNFPNLRVDKKTYLLQLFSYGMKFFRSQQVTRGLNRDEFFNQLEEFGLELSPKPELLEASGGLFRKRYDGAGIHTQLKVFFADEFYTDNKPGLVSSDPEKKLYFLLSNRPTKPVGTDTDKSFLEFIGFVLNDVLVLENKDGDKEFIWFDFKSNKFKKSRSLPKMKVPLYDFLKAKELCSNPPIISKGDIFV